MSKPDERFEVEPSVSTHFAWLRTQLGLQRTLMAAVRTSVSLIGFGFTVAEFFQRLQGPASAHLGPDMARSLGLLLIAAGVISLSVFTYQYHVASSYLRGEPFTSIAAASRRHMRVSTYFSAAVVLLIGVAAFISVLVRF